MARVRWNVRATRLLIGLTLAVMVASGALLTISHSNSAAKQQRLVVGNYETIALMREASIVLQDIEIGQRAYLMTGDLADLEPYERARLRIDTVLRQLEAAAGGDPEAVRQITEFRVAASDKIEAANAAIKTFQLYGREAAMVLGATGTNRQIADHIRQAADSFVERERLLLTRRLALLRSEQEQADIAGLLVLGGAFLCLIAGMYIIVRGAERLEEVQLRLTARTQLLQATLETLRDPIFVLDSRGVVAAWNESFAELAGWDPSKQPVPTLDYLLSERSPAMQTLLAPLKLGQESSDRSLKARVSHDGRDYEVSRGEMSGGGAVVRCVDVSEKLRDEAALRQGQKMEAIGQLTGGMAHDFNNILQVVQANLDLVKGDMGDNSAALGRLRSASAAAERGGRLTQQLLAFARRQPLTPQPTDVARLVSDLADLLRQALGERITIDFAISDGAWNAKIDPGQLENAILNLAINARDAMPEGGTVQIEVSNATLDRRYAALHPEVTPGPYVLVEVSDIGSGMPPDVVAQAVDPFFTTKSDGKGTGLGLSMVYGFVRQSSGHIRIDSAIGQGTSVKLYLPRTLDPVAESPDHAPDVLAGSERVLVVEDNEDVRHAVVELLRSWGYRVVAVESPDVAATVLEKDAAFDLLFADVIMPGTLSAIDLAAMAERLQPGIAVLLTSGYTRDLIPEGRQSSYPLIAKPFRDEELATQMRTVLAARHPQKAGPVRAPAAAPPPSAKTGRATRRVLLVEDEVVLRMSTSDMLEGLGCFVAAVGSGEQALELLSRGASFDLLLTDLGLPGISGEELAVEVRRQFPGLPVVIASGYGRSHMQADGIQFIGKPYSAVDLQQALDHTERTAAS